MAVAADEGGRLCSQSARLGRLALLAWCVAAVAVVAVAFFWLQPTRLTASLGDTDDATRLVEVRELIDGRGWFDNTLPRFGGDHPLQSHWSRLIDAPLAGLLSAFERVMPQANAELALRVVWPLTLLLLLLYLLGRETELRGGRTAALLSVALAATCVTDIVQFLPGRIDHHNAMILCATIGILRLARSFDDPDAGWSAGALLGLGTAIGYESLVLTIAAMGAAVLYGLLPGRSLLGPSRAAVTFAAALAIAFAITTSPAKFFVQYCDALSLNIVALSAIAALGVCAVQAAEHRLSTAAKLIGLSVTAGAALAVYALSEPACLAGPFGQVYKALFPLWFDRVSETQSLLSIGSDARMLVAAAIIYLAIGAYSGFKLLRTDGGDTLRYDLLILLLAIPLSFWQIKLLPYATYLAVSMIAVWLSQTPQTANEKPADKRTLALLAAVVLTVVGAGGWLAWRSTNQSAPTAGALTAALEKTRDCSANTAIEPFADLPAGLAVADVNLGPFLVALTRLDALSAPYHRLGPSILAASSILHSSPADAQKLLTDVGADYVITCPGLNTTAPATGEPSDGLQKLLFEDKPPAFLEPVTLAGPTPLKVWRFVR
jgi:hypothetical protein